MFLQIEMSAILFRKSFSSILQKSFLCRELSTPTRRLMKKGHVSPMNSVPKGIMLPNYIQTGKENTKMEGLSILNDYVRFLIFYLYLGD